MPFLVVLATLVGLYVLVALTLTALHATTPRRRPAPQALPRAAVVVAARDEEDALPACLDALLAQEYPAGRLTIYVADDHSTDGTAEVVRRAQRRAAPAPVLVPAGDGPGEPLLTSETRSEAANERTAPEVVYLRVPDPEGHLRGKAHALHTAIEAAEAAGAEVLLLTDADCVPPPGWAAAAAARFDAPDVGMVCGHTWVEGPRPLDAVQALDWAFLLAIASTLAERGLPVTGMGNNMALRPAAYRATGGYPALPFSVTEDYELVRAVGERTPYRVLFPLDPALDTRTAPLPGLGAVLGQRLRWARGGLRVPLPVYGLYAAGHLVHLLLVVGLAVAPGAALALAAAKVGADAALLHAHLGRFGRRRLLRAMLGFEGLLFLYLTVLPTLLVLRRPVRWKGRAH